MKKKILAIVLCVAMLAIAIVGGTMAYFTDTDSATNTMTMGNIAIEQTEWQRGENEEGFVPFVQDKLMMPAVYENGSASLTKVYFNDESSLNIANGQAWCGMWSESAQQYNAVDKIVVVQNTGKNDVYYRTLIAIEAPGGGYNGSWDQDPTKSDLVFNYNDNNRFTWNYIGDITVDNVTYNLHEALYTEKLAPQEMSRPSLLQLMFTKATTQEDVEAYGDTLDVLCVTQAVQTEGFQPVLNNDGTVAKTAAEVALDAAFGDITTTNHPWATPAP